MNEAQTSFVTHAVATCPCGHQWPVVLSPMETARAMELLHNARCPACAPCADPITVTANGEDAA